MLFIFSIHQLLLTPPTPLSVVLTTFYPLPFRPSGRGWGYTHICVSGVCVRVYVCECVVSLHLSPTPYSFCLSSSPYLISPKSRKQFLSRRALCYRALSTKETDFSCQFSEKLKRRAERACRCGSLSFSVSPPPLLVLSLFYVFHTDTGRVPPSCVCMCVNVNLRASVWFLYLNISIYVCIHTHIVCAHTRIRVRAHTHISIHTHTTSQDSAYCTLHTMHVRTCIQTYTYAHI